MPDEASLLRHSIRGTINALKLGVSAMDTGLTDDEAVEFLDYIIQAADKMNTLLDQYEVLPDEVKVNRPMPATG
jgi:nitrogen-specific signal transduction histidine kinase